MKILVYHRGYGCETGCCGHAVAWFPDDYVPEDKWDYYGYEGVDNFYFEHIYGQDAFEFAKSIIAKRYGEDHIKDLDFENSFIVNGEEDEDKYCG